MKNITLKLLPLLFLMPIGLYSQDNDVLMSVNGNPVYKSEFEQIYWKNKKEDIATKEDLDQYITLFKNFHRTSCMKLK